jgi:hypothetical protein
MVVEKPLDPTHGNLMRIGSAYVRHINEKKKPPQGPQDLRPFLADAGNPDEIFRSARDNEPLVICWGVDILKPISWAKSTPVLAYEKRGADGSRYVLTTVRSVELMPDAEFRQASFPPGHHPVLD